jgi:hypothetical protein
MDLKFPDGYAVATMPERMVITINGRHFTCSEFAELIERRPGERTTTTAHRIANALGVGCVTSR